jgi:hypothetical protein
MGADKTIIVVAIKKLNRLRAFDELRVFVGGT